MIVRPPPSTQCGLVENRNHVFGENRSRRENNRARAARWCPENLHLPLVDAQFHFERSSLTSGAKRVVVGEVHQVQARFAAAGRPTAAAGCVVQPL